MRVEQLDYELPEGRIARRPAERREQSRLLVSLPDRDEHLAFADVGKVLPERCVLVVNDTRVIPARLFGRKPTGGKVEFLLVRREEGNAELWSALGRASKALKPGQRVDLDGGLVAQVERGPGEDGLMSIALSTSTGDSVDALIRAHGHVPLPPYLGRAADDVDRERYQTVYAAKDGAVAAPTAGLHFTPELLSELEERGIGIERVTLHVGPGTFRPVTCEELDEHPMHSEWIEVNAPTAQRLQRAKQEGRSIVAVGTTVVRTLESAVDAEGKLCPFEGFTDLLIQPGHTFRVVDGLITNFHLPRSTLLALVYALGGRGRVRRSYATAIEKAYRFYSYGDAMILPPLSNPRLEDV